jgi:phosphatidylinositol phospholipase C delta
MHFNALFVDVIQAIKDYAFQPNEKNEVNEMPIILSIENHCGWEQQQQMAHILVHILGDMIQRPGQGIQDGLLPSPDALRRKILIKGKRNAAEEDDDSDDDDRDGILTSPSQSRELSLGGDLVGADEGTQLALTAGEIKSKSKKTKGTKPATHPELSAITFLGTCKTKRFSESASVPCDMMSSCSESKTAKHLRKDPGSWIDHNKVHLR